MTKAWLLLAVGDDRQHGGNDGYDDEPDAHYSWDSTVGNSEALAVGDAIVLWDKKRSLGMSVIEFIETGEDDKILRRCSNTTCLKAGIKARSTIRPLYKCYKCGEEFDDPITRIERVKTYRSRHDGGWDNLEGILTGDELRQLAMAPKSQLSLRPLNWTAFESALASKGHLLSTAAVGKRLADLPYGGHTEATVRVRVGQAKFRRALLDRQGLRCGLTGDAPEEVLDACHLYSFAALGVHHEHGGLLLRRDIHTLFDRGQIAIDPVTQEIDVHADLAMYPQYASLAGRQPAIALSPGQLKWVARHWKQYRP
ncbi:HNH endonuclease signature motif containing protein [Arthrobacter sp. B0490]|uniref:HNH endonuclease signature motif containing protein n=1 Tax=Arthrobacter sp. B0490 TaxID=2058891 RepID=UPI000CE4DC58|nr:HNH endonuclease signature motif containing protein [Arthrobacter sp. B0490]